MLILAPDQSRSFLSQAPFVGFTKRKDKTALQEEEGYSGGEFIDCL